jgi:hemin uptake protein HemP
MRTIIVRNVSEKLHTLQQPRTRLDRQAASAPVRISSGALLGPKGEVVILHGGREYRLRVTQNGKLILTA